MATEFTADSNTPADSNVTVDNPAASITAGFTADSSITADSRVTVDNPVSSTAQYPNVPAMPGVPLLARQQTAASVTAAASGAGLNAALAMQLGLPAGTVFGSSSLYAGLNLEPLDPSYSIVDDQGKEVISPDSAVELEVNVDSSINTHPIELGQFEGYNRVQQQVPIRLLLACQGIKMPYTAFLARLKSLREGTELVTLALPNDSYSHMALKGFGYSRKAERGAITIWADTRWLEQRSTNVVVTAPPTTQPQGAPPANLGAVLPATPSRAQQASISNPPVAPVLAPPQYTDPVQVAAGITNPLVPPPTPIGNGGTPPSLVAF